MPEMTVDEAMTRLEGLASVTEWKEDKDAIDVVLAELSRLRAALRAAEEKVGELSRADLFFYEDCFDESYGSIERLVEMEELSVGDTFSIHRARVIDAIQVRIEAQNNGEYRLIDPTTGKEIGK